MVTPVKRPYMSTVLPLTFSETLSYYEEIEKLRLKLNETINALNDVSELASHILADAKAYTDEKLIDFKTEQNAYMENRLNVFETDINAGLSAFQREFETLFDDYKQELDDWFLAELSEMIATLDDIKDDIVSFKIELQKDNEMFKTEVQSSIDTMYGLVGGWSSIIDSRFIVLTEKLMSEIDEKVATLNRLYVRDPTTGKTEPIQVVLDNLFRIASQFGLTVTEYDNLVLTADEYEKLELTAYEYNFRARLHFLYQLYLSMVSPVSGRYLPVTDIILELAGLHKENAITAENYANKSITAVVYEGYNITAYDYNFKAGNIL